MTPVSDPVESILAAAVEIDSDAERKQYVEQACAGDAELRRRIEVMIENHFRAGSFLESPAPDLGAVAEGALGERPGSVIGPYKLLEQIGEGGFGVVFMAEQTAPVRRKVALKVIKPGMDTKQVIARFEAERQALALMDHPSIAKVFDGGVTPGGRPYFVMELVRGVPITDYCDQNHLSPRDRLELFLGVCQAIQHAHQKGIIHRDLKPSNVLVSGHDGKPAVKVIDFGVAKATGHQLTDRTLFTGFAQLVGTPLYMSPEQAALSPDIDTRSDVYSLGVLLYELLTGTTPYAKDRFRLAAYEEIRRIIREEDPPKPSTRLSESKESLPTISAQRHMEPAKLTRLVRGELDWIVMKCLEKDRNRRYESATGLARDVQRHLADEPVEACPPSAGYKLRKYAHKHKRPLLVAGGFASLLVGGVIISTWQAVRATRAETDARKNERQAVTAAQAEADARRDALDKLRDSYLAQARAGRWSGQPGRRFDSLEALAKAARIRPGLDLRNEAVACLALADLRPVKQWNGRPARQEDWGVAFDANLERYARSDDKDGSISVRRTADHVEVQCLPGPAGEGIWAPRMQFSPDGRFLAAGYFKDGTGVNDDTRVWDISRGEVVLQFPGYPDFSPDGRRVVVPSDQGSLRVYDLESRAEVKRVEVSPGTMHVRFHPKEEKLAVLYWGRPLVKILDLDTGKVLSELSHPSGVACVDWHPDGKLLATSCADKLIYLWNTATGQQHAILEGHRAEVRICVFNHGGDLLASYGWDGVTRLWDPVGGKQLVSIPGAVQRFSRDDRYLAYAHLGSDVGLWEVARGRECRTLHASGQQPAWSVAISPRGRLLVSEHADGVLRLWDLATDQEIAQLPIPASQAFFDPTGDALITTGRHGIHRWPITLDVPGGDLRIGPPQALSRSPASSSPTSLSRNGRWLATLVGRWEAQVIDLERPTAIVRLGSHLGRDGIAISPDGRWAVTSTQHGWGVKVWDVRSGELIKEIPAGNYSRAAFSPDGRWLVTSSLTHPRQTWEVGSWQEFPYEKRHGGGVFSPDGKLLALTHRAGSMSLHHGLELIDAVTGHDLATLAAPNQLHAWSVAFSPDGSQLAVTEYGRIWLWDLRTVRRELAMMGLDWNLPPYPPPGPAPRTLRVEVQLGELADLAKSQPHLAEPLNDEAWRLATAPDPKARNPARAIELARKAVAFDPYNGAAFNTLGVAHYRAGDWTAAVAALEKSMALRNGGDSYDWFFLVMAHWRLGDKEQARKRYDQAVEWMDKNAPTNGELRRFRAETEALMGTRDKKETEPKQ